MALMIMPTKNYLSLLTAGFFLLTACNTTTNQRGEGTGSEQVSLRQQNVTMLKLIEDRKATPIATDFPVLSNMPSTLPARYTPITVEMLKAAMRSRRDALYDSVATDRITAEAERAMAIMVPLSEGQADMEVSGLQDAATILRRLAAEDLARGKNRQATTMPVLGGLPPKSERPTPE